MQTKKCVFATFELSDQKHQNNNSDGEWWENWWCTSLETLWTCNTHPMDTSRIIRERVKWWCYRKKCGRILHNFPSSYLKTHNTTLSNDYGEMKGYNRTTIADQDLLNKVSCSELFTISLSKSLWSSFLQCSTYGQYASSRMNNSQDIFANVSMNLECAISN